MTTPDLEHAQLARIAHLYYDNDLTQQEIGELLGIPRIKVTRLLAEARRTGVVTVVIDGDAHAFADEEDALRRCYGLEGVWIAPTSTAAAKTQAAVAKAGAAAVQELVTTASMVAVGLSSAVVATARALPEPIGGPARTVGFIPLAGSWGKPSGGVGPHELATMFARSFQGVTHSFPSPLIAKDAEVARQFREDPAVMPALDRARGADVLLVGVGNNRLDATSLLSRLVSEREAREVRARGAVGDISARFFDGQGRHVASHLDERVVGLTLDELVNIPRRLGIAYGPEKIEALRAALTGAVINNLVTDVETARALLRTARSTTTDGNTTTGGKA